MLDSRTISTVKQLLAQGYLHAVIAKKYGLSRSTVKNIGKGRPADQHKRRGVSHPKKIGLCPHHGKVTQPCIACAAVIYRRQHPERNWGECDPAQPLHDDRREQELGELWRQINETEASITLGYE